MKCSFHARYVNAIAPSSTTIELDSQFTRIRVAQAREDGFQFLGSDLRVNATAARPRLNGAVASIAPDPTLHTGFSNGKPRSDGRVASFAAFVRLYGAQSQLGRM